MASDKDASCANDPEFAVICAFLEKFGEDLQLDYPDFKQLQDWLMDTDQVPNGLRDLHIKLMRKTRKTVHECAWETALSKFCFTYSSQDGWEIERFGYKKSSLKVKLRILRELLESQFDQNNKFRAKILTMSADSLRSQPIGRDRLGHAYWLTQDIDCNIRIYQEHLDEEIWQVVATNRDELVKLISRLKGNEVVLPSEIGIVDEDSSSNSCSVPVIKEPPPEEKDDSQESSHSTEGRIPNIKIKLGSKENGVVVKSEPMISGTEVRENGNGEREEEKKVKPLVISHSKITMEKSKKRVYEEAERLEPEQVKKQRPTLLDSKREKKLSKYEKAEQEDEEDDEDTDDEEGDEEGEEEGDEETDCEGEEEDDEGEEEGGEDAGEEEEEEDDDVGEAVEDPPVIVQGEGNGEDCESVYFHHFPSDDFDLKPEFSEVIEETILHIFGEGAGADCLVGNAKTSESEPKATFFFGQPGCLKLSPLKNQPKSDEPPLNCQGEEKKPTEPSNGENHSEPTEELTKNDHHEPKEVTPDPNKSESQPAKSPEERRPIKSIIINRKRRLSGEKHERPPRHSSESETDLNSEILDEQQLDLEDEIDVDHGGKRPKMRVKILNTEIRKKVEAQRKNTTIEETTSSSGEDERPRKKIVPRKVEKEVEKMLPLKAKLKQAAVTLARALTSPPVEDQVKPEEEKKVEKSIPIEPAPKLLPEDVKAEVKVETTATDEPPLEEIKQEIHSPEKSSPPEKTSVPDTPSVTEPPPPESKELKSEPPPEDHVTIENQRKRRSSEDEPHVEKPPTPPPVPVKTRFSRRTGPPEPVVELPLPKRTRVKANNSSQIKKETEKQPSKTNTKSKGKAQVQDKSAVVKEEDTKPHPEPPIPTDVQIPPADEPVIKEEIKVEESPKPVPVTPKPISTPRPRQQAAQKQPATVQRRKNHDAIDTSNIIDTESEITPVRQSRRIAQLKIREEAERRKMEEIALRNMKAELKKKQKAEKADDPTVSEPSEHSSDHADSEVEIKKKIEKKKKCPGKGGWSSGSEEPEEEEEDQYETDPGSPLFKSDHEFSPESDLEDESLLVPLKRARTARKEGEEVVPTADADESCQKCGKSDHPEWILLCDKCDKGYHCSCLSPVLFYIPEGDWFCPPCQQEELIAALENHLKAFDDLVQRKKEEEEERIRFELQLKLELEKAAQAQREKRNKKKKVRQRKKASGSSSRNRTNRTYRKKPTSDDDDEEDESSGESATETDASNASKSASSKSDSSRSNSTSDSDNEPIYKLRKRRQINVSYRLNEFDDMIKSALKEEEDEVAGAGNLGRGKDISTIIEADKEEKLRQQQQRIAEENGEAVEEVENPTVPRAAAEDSGSDFEPVKRKPRAGHNLKKKSRKLTTLDISSEGDNDSDEDFKTSSMEDDDEEDEEEEDSQSDSSLEVYRRRHRSGKGKKKTRRAARHAARERRKDRKFIVEDSEFSDEEEQPRSKKKRKKDSDYTESETNDDDDDDELSENIDSDDLCDDSTDSEASDDAWRPSKRKKQRSNAVARKSPKLKAKISSKGAKTKRPSTGSSSSHKPVAVKNRVIRDESDDNDDSGDSLDSSRKTRGKKCLYLEDFYEDESSDGGIKPGVKRPDTPPEEREQFIKKQEEIKRMLAEKNAEGAKLAATPRLVPIKGGAQKSPAKLDALSTVPPSVIRQAKVLDIDYLQRKGESISEGDLDESEFGDDDLPDFSPEDMDEEAIARMVEEEDFAQQQLKLPNPVEVLRKKTETVLKPMPHASVPQPPQAASSASGLQEPIRKKLPMPTIHPPLLRHGYGSPSQHMLHQQNRSSGPQHLPLLQNALSAPLNHPSARGFPPATQPIPATNQSQGGAGAGGGLDPNKPRGRRKKITPLRDPLEKQQAAAAASAAAAAASKPRIDSISAAKVDVSKSTPGSGSGRNPGSAPVSTSALVAATPGVIKSALSIAQPPQLYKPPPTVNTQPSVITRMPHLQGRPMIPVGGPPFPEQGSRYYRPPPAQGQQQQPPPPNALIQGSRPPMRHRNQMMPPMSGHHTLRPSYVGGPPPLRSATGGGPSISLANDIREQGPGRQPSAYSGPDQYAPPSARHSAPPHLSPYRPQMYGSPGFPQRGPPANSSQPSNMRSAGAPPEYSSPGSYVSGYGYYPPPPLSVPHSTPQPPTASAVPSSVIVSASSLAASATAPSAPPPPPPPQVAIVPSRPPASSPSVLDKPLVAPVAATITPPSVIELSRKPKLTTLETFNTSKVGVATPPPPLADSSESRSPYSSNPATTGPGVDDAPDDNSASPTATEQSTSEFSGLVSYFSSQHDDLNT